jgi:Uma2 family endonuclease
MATVSTTQLTAEAFAERYGHVPNCELIRGEIVQMSPGAWGHSRVTGRAYSLVDRWATQTRLGRPLTNEYGLITRRNPDTVRGADVTYFSYARVPRGREPVGYSSVAPELVIVVLGKGQGWDDMVEKAGEYLQMGVDRVWILDPDHCTVHVFRSDAEPQRLCESDDLTDEAILPGFSCRVAEFFED